MGPKLRAPTEGEARAHKRQLELLVEDCTFVCAPDVQQAFNTLQDAVDRLVPFHVGLSHRRGGTIQRGNDLGAPDRASPRWLQSVSPAPRAAAY
jgi:hypothetical protein